MRNRLYDVVFCFLLMFICISNILYASSNNYSVTLLAIGMHYQGQPDDVWVVKEITNSPVYTFRDGQIQPALEVGIAGGINEGVVDKIAVKWIFTEEGGNSETGWEMGAYILDQETPPADALNFLSLPGGVPITFDANSNKKLVFQGNVEGPVAVVITDM